MSEIATAQGELIVGNVIHGAAVNCMIVPYADPTNWYMKQFFSDEAMRLFAFEQQLIIKEKE